VPCREFGSHASLIVFLALYALVLVREEIEKFFVATDELEDKTLKFLGWKGAKTGERLIDAAAKAFKRDGKTS
jgi:hypothetical protein